MLVFVIPRDGVTVCKGETNATIPGSLVINQVVDGKATANAPPELASDHSLNNGALARPVFSHKKGETVSQVTLEVDRGGPSYSKKVADGHGDGLSDKYRSRVVPTAHCPYFQSVVRYVA